MAREPSLSAQLAEWWLSRFEGAVTQPGVLIRPLWLASALMRLAKRDVVEGIQLIRLLRTVDYTAGRSPFYHDRFHHLGIEPRQIRSLADLPALPFTTSEDLTEPEGFLCVPREKIGHVFTTSGTTGEPKHVYFTFRDFQSSVRLVAAALVLRLAVAPELPQHIVALITLPQGLWIGSHQAERLVEQVGGLALPIGTPNPAETLEDIARFRPNVMFSSPSYLAALTKTAREKGLKPQVPYLVLAGEMLLPDEEEYYAEYWQAAVLNGYGTTEIGGGQAIALPGCCGLHLNELSVLAEIVDSETGASSSHGELVVTTLNREAMPLIRYRTGDAARWVDCGCGLPLRSFVVEGRLDDRFVAGGVNMYGRVIAAAITKIPGVTGRVDIALDKADLTDQLELLVERLPGHEVSPKSAEDALLRIYPDLARRIEVGALDLAISVAETLEPSAKSFRIVDRRRG